MATNGCVEVLNADTKKQLGISTDLTEIATMIIVVALTKRSGPQSYIDTSYLARPKTRDAKTLTGIVRPADCVVLAITHVSCKVRDGHMS